MYWLELFSATVNAINAIENLIFNTISENFLQSIIVNSIGKPVVGKLLNPIIDAKLLQNMFLGNACWVREIVEIFLLRLW